MRRAFRIAFAVWAAISVLVAASVLVIYLRWGPAGFDLFIQQWPLTNLPIALASVTVTWLLFGTFLYFLQAGRINNANVLTFSGFFLANWVYLNSLSERYRYGDYTYYQEAAANLAAQQRLPDTYFYPPLWATLLKPISFVETSAFLLVLWAVNIVSFMVFFILLHIVLEKYGFSPRFSAIVTTLFLLVNAPLLRTLNYVQVNIHTMNFILASLLLYPKRPILSALMLAIAVHLKASPLVLALAFLLEKDWRWLIWFALYLILLAGVTFVTNGIAPFLDVLYNWQGLTLSKNAIFHDTSFDSFLRFVDPFLGIDLFWTRILVYALKVLLAAATFFVMARCVRNQTFYESKERGARLLNAILPLFILMTLASPVVWEHHGIFTALAFLLLLKRLDAPSEWMWFGFAYFLEFILPTFDFFPWSYGRLIAPLIILGLMWSVTRKQETQHFFTAFNSWLMNLPEFKA